MVQTETTGAAGVWPRVNVRPLATRWTVVRAANAARSCAPAAAGARTAAPMRIRVEAVRAAARAASGSRLPAPRCARWAWWVWTGPARGWAGTVVMAVRGDGP